MGTDTTYKKVEATTRLFEDGETLENALQINGIVNSTYNKYLNEYPELERAYMRAQMLKAELYAEDCVAIADTDPDPHRAKNRISTRQWYAARLKPHKYGESLQLQVDSGPNITQALADARSRALPVCYHGDTVDAQVIESQGNDGAVKTGNLPVTGKDSGENSAEPGDSSDDPDDIFT